MFTEGYRKKVHDRVLGLAAEDTRIVASAVVGSLALSDGDRWSDLDLTFAVSERFAVTDVLADWTGKLIQEFDAVSLFDLVAGASIYRVFLLPGCLQFDLSFTPASEFGASGPKFKLLSGVAIEKPHIQPTPAEELFGYAAHHAVRARVCVERGRFWQAEYWIGRARDYALSLACRRRGLSPFHGRGFDDLPADARERFVKGLVASLDRGAVLEALRVVVEGLLHEASDLPECVEKVEPRLRELLQS
ncbi:MAG TPA: hypothetical protein VGI60_00190 [Chthoniobacterales bacterium]|jgi:hypothetical protein